MSARDIALGLAENLAARFGFELFSRATMEARDACMLGQLRRDLADSQEALAAAIASHAEVCADLVEAQRGALEGSAPVADYAEVCAERDQLRDELAAAQRQAGELQDALAKAESIVTSALRWAEVEYGVPRHPIAVLGSERTTATLVNAVCAYLRREPRFPPVATLASGLLLDAEFDVLDVEPDGGPGTARSARGGAT